MGRPARRLRLFAPPFPATATQLGYFRTGCATRNPLQRVSALRLRDARTFPQTIACAVPLAPFRTACFSGTDTARTALRTCETAAYGRVAAKSMQRQDKHSASFRSNCFVLFAKIRAPATRPESGPLALPRRTRQRPWSDPKTEERAQSAQRASLVRRKTQRCGTGRPRSNSLTPGRRMKTTRTAPATRPPM